MKKPCFFAATLFAALLTFGTAGRAFAHPPYGYWNRSAGAWGHRWRGARLRHWRHNRWAYGRGYMNPGWGRGHGDGDDDGRWGGYGYRRFPYGGYGNRGYGMGRFLPFGGDDGDDD